MPTSTGDKLFKNWLEPELKEAIQKFGDGILVNLKEIQVPRPFVERFLLCLIAANVHKISSEQIRKRLRTAMLELFGRVPKHRSSKRDDNHVLIWMAEEYILARTPGWSKAKPRSIETLAAEAAKFAEGFGKRKKEKITKFPGGEEEDPAVERLRKAFSSRRKELLESVDDLGLKIEQIQRAALNDLAERLALFGIELWPDD